VAVYQRVFHRETIFSPTRHGKAIAEGRGKRLHGVVVRKGENYGFIQPGDSGAEEKDNFGTLKSWGRNPVWTEYWLNSFRSI
jgi:hypothetical protein